VHEGQTVAIELPHAPGEKLAGASRACCRGSTATRAPRACASIPEPGLRLRPDMYATVRSRPTKASDHRPHPLLHAGERLLFSSAAKAASSHARSR
jgi:hypothetical protein